MPTLAEKLNEAKKSERPIFLKNMAILTFFALFPVFLIAMYYIVAIQGFEQ